MSARIGIARDLERAASAARALTTLAYPTGGRFGPDREVVVGDGATRFDAYEPQTVHERPTLLRGHVLIVHGGAFTVGSPRMKPVRVLARSLVDAGYGVLSVGYPLVRESTTIAEQVAAVKRALQSAYAAARSLEWLPAPRFAVGFSAGATLLLLAAAELDASGGSGLDAVASVFGLYDFRSLDGPLSRRIRAKVLGSSELAAAAQWSPVTRRGPMSPVLFVHGDADGLVEFAQAEAIHATRTAAGLESALVPIEGSDHAFFNHPESHSTRRAIGEILRFVARFGGGMGQVSSQEHTGRVELDTLPIAAVVVRAGIIESLNAACVGLMGFDAHELIGRDVHSLIRENVTAPDATLLDEVVRLAPQRELTLALRARDAAGRLRSLRVLIRPSGRRGASIAYLIDEERDARVRELGDAMIHAGSNLMEASTDEEIMQRVVDSLVPRRLGVMFLRFTADRTQLAPGPIGASLPTSGRGSIVEAAPRETIPAAAFLKNVTGFADGHVTFFADYESMVERSLARDLSETVQRMRAGNGVGVVPLLVRGEPYGALVLFGRNLSHALDGSMSRLGAQVVRALEALRSQREQIERERLAALGEAAAVMAHEVRNPVAAILNAVTLLKRRSEEFEALVDVIGEESRRLDRIVSNLLTLGRPLSPELRPVDASELVRLTLDVHRQRDASLASAIKFTDEMPIAPILVDPDLMQLALLNVIRNACEAIDPGGRVVVTFEPRSGNRLAVVVDDSGPGLSNEVSARLFEPFFTTRPAGTGVGLAVVRRVVEACRGRVEASRGPLGGARIALVFPLAQPSAALSR
jgi:two-component system sensor histidine kinase HydH